MDWSTGAKYTCYKSRLGQFTEKKPVKRKADHLTVKSVAMGYCPVDPGGRDCGRVGMFVHYCPRRLNAANVALTSGRSGYGSD